MPLPLVHPFAEEHRGESLHAPQQPSRYNSDACYEAFARKAWYGFAVFLAFLAACGVVAESLRFYVHWH